MMYRIVNGGLRAIVLIVLAFGLCCRETAVAAAPSPQAVQVPCPPGAITPPTGTFLKAVGDQGKSAFVLTPVGNVQITKQVWTYPTKGAADPNWGTFNAADGTNELDWSAPLETQTFTVSVTFHRHCDGGGPGVGNGPPDDDPTVTWNANAMGVIILQDGNNITAPGANGITVSVGQMINLTTQIQNGPNNPTVTIPQWTIPGTNYNNWTGTQHLSTLTPTTTTAQNTSFYWVDGSAARQVSYTVTVNGVNLSANSASFTVNRPTVTFNDHVAGGITEYNDGRADMLSFGSPGQTDANENVIQLRMPGFQLYNVTPSDNTGTVDFVQLVSSTQRKRVADGTPNGTWLQFYPTSGADAYLYPSSSDPDKTVQFGPNLGLHAEDSPGTYLVGDHGRALLELTVQSTFTMWVMWRPNTPGSVDVPLMSDQWGFSGSLEPQADGTYQVGSVAIASSGPTAKNPDVNYPSWTNGITDNAKWQ